MYPKIEIYLDRIIENAVKMKEICENNGVKLSLVTKVLVDHLEIVKKIVDSGIDSICESRIENLKSYASIQAEKWLIRGPQLCQIEDVVRFSDVSLNSEIATITALNEEAKKQNKIHKIILVYELGDLREGANKEELTDLVKQSLLLSNIEIYGIGTNLTCYGAIMPSKENMEELVEVVTELENKFSILFPIISGGNSSSYEMLVQNKLPKKINNLRIGEAVFLGNIPGIEKTIPDLNQNNFLLKAQIVEFKEKPSVPRGISGNANSFGEEPVHYEDKGIRKRALIALGKQDINFNSIFPIDTDILVLGGASDLFILDVTDSKKEYQVGDIVEFKLNYSGVLHAMNSKYIEKDMRKE